jgi:hypothetical protein
MAYPINPYGDTAPIVGNDPDHIGFGALHLDGKVVAIHPWFLLCGGNGHRCVALQFIDVLDPTVNLGAHLTSQMPDRRTMSIVSSRPIKMHITLLHGWEYGIWVPQWRVRQAEAYITMFHESIQRDDHTQIGMGPLAMGTVLKWTTNQRLFEGHSECFDITVTPESRRQFGVFGPSATYVEYVATIQDRLQAFLTHVRELLGFTAPKANYHISIRRV